jgi:hypothetical protein
MIANGSPENDRPIFAEFQKIIAKPEDMDIEPLALPSAESKDLVRKAFAVITRQRSCQ